MHNVRKINDDLYYIGSSSRRVALFENVYPIPYGASYNSYFVDGDETLLFDTIDKSLSEIFFENLSYCLKGRKLDYMIINHIEPDHSSMIQCVVEKYPDVKIICNQKTKQMLYQFFEFDFDIEGNFKIIKEGDKITISNHEYTFIMAPMVHWPEAMVTYDITKKILYSADAFGSFGALDGNLFDCNIDFNERIDEYRRYYTNIVGKYGLQVNNLLKKASSVQIDMICPLHGLILKENIPLMIDKYMHWANYEPEIKSVLIAYASVYGSTENASEILASKLSDLGVKNIKMYDVSKTHPSYILADAFKYSHIVIASSTYNNNIFVNMDNFLSDIVKHNLQNRCFAIIENGSWAPCAANCAKAKLEALLGTKFIGDILTVKSSLKKSQESDIDKLAKDIFNSLK